MKKKNLIFRSVSLACILSALFAYQSVASERSEIVAENEAQVKEIEEYNREIRAKMAADASEAAAELAARGPYGTDGYFQGTGTGYGGPIEVEVLIIDGYIDSIEILSHDSEDLVYFGMAEEITETMVNNQTADVDTVSGATLSSKGIIEAVTKALEKAE